MTEPTTRAKARKMEVFPVGGRSDREGEPLVSNLPVVRHADAHGMQTLTVMATEAVQVERDKTVPVGQTGKAPSGAGSMFEGEKKE